MSTTWLGSLGFASWIVLASQGTPKLHGRVLDAAGEPALGARVSRAWRFPDPGGATGTLPEGLIGQISTPVTVDERGEFDAFLGGDAFLFALSADARSGALVPLPALGSAPVELALAPLVEVRARFEVKTPGEPPKQTALWVSAGAGMPVWVAGCFSESRAFRVDLPPGTYTLWYSTDAVNLWSMSQLREEPLVIQAGQATIELGAFELELPLVLHPEGAVLDAEGRPVRASLAESWGLHGGRMTPHDGFSTDENGRFRGNVAVYDEARELTLLALDQAQDQAALATWNPARAEEPLEIRLQPAIRVFGRYRTSAGDVPSWTNTYVHAVLPGGARPPRIAECQSGEGQARFEFRLPPGKYRLNGYGTNTKDADLEVELGPDARERDLGVLELPQTIIARNAGQEAMPWRLTDARGLSKEAKLADFRGKWVLLEFWGFW